MLFLVPIQGNVLESSWCFSCWFVLFIFTQASPCPFFSCIFRNRLLRDSELLARIQTELKTKCHSVDTPERGTELDMSVFYTATRGQHNQAVQSVFFLCPLIFNQCDKRWSTILSGIEWTSITPNHTTPLAPIPRWVLRYGFKVR